MAHKVFYPDLKIVPLTRVVLQEDYHDIRARQLTKSFEAEGVLRNPPIVTPLNGAKSYLHLDGATRLTVIKQLRYPNILVQIVDYADRSQVDLSSWSHMATIEKEQFVAFLKNLADVTVRTHKTFHNRTLLSAATICEIVFADGPVVTVEKKGSVLEKVRVMDAIVCEYGRSEVTRVFSASPWTRQSMQTRFDRYPQHNALVAFPTFSPEQVMEVVEAGECLPAGVTRHLVYRRKLNINLPLEYLAIKDLRAANEKLQHFVGHRAVRLYEEPVVYFE